MSDYAITDEDKKDIIENTEICNHFVEAENKYSKYIINNPELLKKAVLFNVFNSSTKLKQKYTLSFYHNNVRSGNNYILLDSCAHDDYEEVYLKCSIIDDRLIEIVSIFKLNEIEDIKFIKKSSTGNTEHPNNDVSCNIL